nr:uncharacterized protein LOC119159595 [Rhipicephalus microplus]
MSVTIDQPNHRLSLPFVSVEEDDKKAADTSTWIKSSNDDVGKLSSTQLERELVRGKSLTDVYTAACQPPLTPVINSLPFSIEKNGEKDAASTANGRTLISSSNDNHYDASILSREHPGNELPKEKVSTGSNTPMSQLPLNAASSFFSSGENSERNGTAKVIPDNSEQASVSCKDDDHASELSSKHPEPEKPVFIFGVTLPNRKHLGAVATVHVEMPSEKDLSITCAICRGLNAKEVSGKFNKSSVCLSVGPHFEEETLELSLDEEIRGVSRNLPRGRLSSEFSKALRYIAENKNFSTASDEGFCPSNFSPEVSAVTYSPEAELPPSTSRPSTTTSGTHLVPATSSPMKTAPTLLTASESGYASSSPVGHVKDMLRRPEKASPRKRSHRGRAK